MVASRLSSAGLIAYFQGVRSTIFAFVGISVAALLACGGSQPAPTPPAPDAPPAASETPAAEGGDAGASASADPAPKASEAPAEASGGFDSLSKDKKVEVMVSKVVPNVGKVFKEHDAKKFDKFTCATCHGPSKKEDPHKVLPKLAI